MERHSTKMGVPHGQRHPFGRFADDVDAAHDGALEGRILLQLGANMDRIYYRITGPNC